MGSGESSKGRSRGRTTEAFAIFIVTIVVLAIITVALSSKSAEPGERSHALSNGGYIEYSFHGIVNNVSVGGELIYHFTERIDRGTDYFITTLTPSAPSDQMPPFDSKPLIFSEYFHYDGENLFNIGGLLVNGLNQYNGGNASDPGFDWFGQFINYQNVNQNNFQIAYSNGEAAHYRISQDGTTLEQWVANGTGLPIVLTYTDGIGTDLTLEILKSNIQWIPDLPRR